jgi:hypothetical protein
MSELSDSRILPGEFEPARVPDARFARAYAAAGDRGRALIKSQIAALYPAYADHAASVSLTARLHGGQERTVETAPRPWHMLVIDPDAAAPAHVVAAVLPAVARRIPALAVRIGGRGGWPPALLAALELCGVEQVFSMGIAKLKQSLKNLAVAVPGGSAAVLCAAPLAQGASVSEGACASGGNNAAPVSGGASERAGRPFHERVRAVVPSGVVFHVHEAPSRLALLEGQGVDEEAVAFAHAGVPVRRLASPGALAEESGEPAQAVFAPAALAPASARVVLAPGRESVWEWPNAPDELFIARRLVYS